jgi:homoserine kinase
MTRPGVTAPGWTAPGWTVSGVTAPGLTVSVRVPATSANLGPGFDSLGLALTLYDDIEASIEPAGLQVEIDGEGAGLADEGENHLIIRAMRRGFDRFAGQQPPGIRLRCVNRIPHGRGLGSSAAAIVAGLLAARALTGAPADVDLLNLATEIEGHPDNVAACLLGGLTIAWTTENGSVRAGEVGGKRCVRAGEGGGRGLARAVTLEPAVRPVVCIAPPEVAVATELARKALPPEVPHVDAAANAGRAALLIAALTQPRAAGELLDATRDWLHQEYRKDAMPDTYALVTALREQGYPAVVSGAGPSVLVLTSANGSDSGRLVDSLGSIVRETGKAWHISSLDVARQGARVQRVGGHS